MTVRLLAACVLLCSFHAGHATKTKKKPVRRPPQKTAAKPRKGPPPAPKTAVERLGYIFKMLQDGELDAARRGLTAEDLGKLLNRDYGLYALGQANLLAGQPETARAHFAELAALKGSRFKAIAKVRLADCDWELERLEDARKQYEVALAGASGAVDVAVVRFRIAEALEKKGDVKRAQAAYKRVVLEQPLHPLAEAAVAKAGELTPAERIERAKRMTRDRAWARAIEELALVPADVPQAVRDETEYWIGTNKFKMRRDYDVAAKKLLGVWARLPGESRRAEALFHGARAWSRADKDDEAIKHYREVVARFPRSSYAPEASFLIGWLDFNRARYKEAIPALAETIKRFPRSSYAVDARWYLGFSRWLSGDVEGALSDFERLASHGGALIGGKGGYWAGRALDQLGRKAEAEKTWRGVVARYPLGYYATQSRARLKERGVELQPFGEEAASGGVPALGDVDEALAQEPIIARADELIAAGLTVEASYELRRGERELMKRYGRDRALPILLDRYVRGENFQRPHRLAESYSGRALLRDPHADPMVKKWWEQIYPRAYRALIEKYAPTGDNPPYYLYTIMQKESAYNPHDVSYADAIGLLQMIPPTSRRVAERIGFPYTDDVLYDPEGNIRFGAWYIGHLLQKFRGQIPIGAGSYNAGPKAMLRWLEKNGERPLDEFIELCSYTQTREYMKKVIDIYARYLWLYEKQDYLPDAKVDTSARDDDGIDY